MKLYLEPKYFKRNFVPLSYCPHPQYNTRCMGVFIKTRQHQTECVECMIKHNTISRHPLLKKITTAPHIRVYAYHGVTAEDQAEVDLINQLIHG